MEFVKGYQCTICNKFFDKDYQELTCDHCNEIGILDVIYDYESMKKHRDTLLEESEESFMKIHKLEEENKKLKN